MMTPSEIRGVPIKTHCMKIGYDLDQVDDILDAAADSLEVMGQLWLSAEVRARRAEARLAACQPVRSRSRVSYAGRTRVSPRRVSVWTSR